MRFKLTENIILGNTLIKKGSVIHIAERKLDDAYVAKYLQNLDKTEDVLNKLYDFVIKQKPTKLVPSNHVKLWSTFITRDLKQVLKELKELNNIEVPAKTSKIDTDIKAEFDDFISHVEPLSEFYTTLKKEFLDSKNGRETFSTYMGYEAGDLNLIVHVVNFMIKLPEKLSRVNELPVGRSVNEL